MTGGYFPPKGRLLYLHLREPALPTKVRLRPRGSRMPQHALDRSRCPLVPLGQHRFRISEAGGLGWRKGVASRNAATGEDGGVGTRKGRVVDEVQGPCACGAAPMRLMQISARCQSGLGQVEKHFRGELFVQHHRSVCMRVCECTRALACACACACLFVPLNDPPCPDCHRKVPDSANFCCFTRARASVCVRVCAGECVSLFVLLNDAPCQKGA